MREVRKKTDRWIAQVNTGYWIYPYITVEEVSPKKISPERQAQDNDFTE